MNARVNKSNTAQPKVRIQPPYSTPNLIPQTMYQCKPSTLQEMTNYLNLLMLTCSVRDAPRNL